MYIPYFVKDFVVIFIYFYELAYLYLIEKMLLVESINH